jgi:lysozyme family protein
MQHPFDALRGEYTVMLARMQITRVAAVDAAAQRLARLIDAGHYAAGCAATGVPQAVAAASFDREASSNFALSPCQGDPIDRKSVHVPAGRGPYANWTDAQIDAYHIDHLDAVGASNWTWELGCYYEELFNGFGPRNHGKVSGYLMAGTSAYTGGKYVTDRVWNPNAQDEQLGVIPVAYRIVQLRPALALPVPFPAGDASGTLAPIGSPTAPPQGLRDAAALQAALNSLGASPLLTVDDSYGRETRVAVEAFQRAAGLEVDGIAGPETWIAINAKLKAGTS